MNEPAQERHWHWEFTAYNNGDVNNEAHTIGWPVTVSVIGYLCEADARIAARDIIERDEMVLRSVRECNTCGFQTRVADAVRGMADAVQRD